MLMNSEAVLLVWTPGSFIPERVRISLPRPGITEVTSPYGHALHFDGTSDGLTLAINTHQICLYQPLLCNDGITFSFCLALHSASTDKYAVVFDSGGVRTIGNGFAIVVRSDYVKFWINHELNSGGQISQHGSE